MNKIKENFKYEKLVVEWVSLNIANFRDSKVIDDRLFPTPQLFIEDKY